MRITESIIAYDFLFNVNKSREKITELQNQLASGKRVQKPSDDPAAADTILRLKASIERADQFKKNVADGQGMLEMTAQSLDSFGTLMQELQEIMTQANNPAQSGALSTHADRVTTMIDEAIALGNTKFNGKYIFGGTETQTAPYSLVTNPGPPPTQSAVYSGNAGTITYVTGDGASLAGNIDGNQAFQGTGIINKLIQIRDSLRAGVPPSGTDMDTINGMMTSVLQTGSKVGSLLQTFDNAAIHLDEQRNQLLALLSVQQDTDVAEATMYLKHQEIMLDAALNTGARIIPKSLLDFM